jgi:hypothetical protein
LHNGFRENVPLKSDLRAPVDTDLGILVAELPGGNVTGTTGKERNLKLELNKISTK